MDLNASSWVNDILLPSRVVPNQKEKFESDDLMKKHTREGEVSFVLIRKNICVLSFLYLNMLATS